MSLTHCLWLQASGTDDGRDGAILNDFQRLSTAEQEEALSSSKVGVSIEFWQDIVRESQQKVSDMGDGMVSTDLLRQYGMAAGLPRASSEPEANLTQYRGSTQALWDLVLEPQLSGTTGSFVQKMFAEDADFGRFLGLSNMYVMHSPLSSFAGLESAIHNHMERTQQDLEHCFLWLDIFSMDMCAPDDGIEQSIVNGLGDAETALLVMEPWNTPHSLRSTQNLFEILHCSTIACPLVAAMSNDDGKALKKSLVADGVEHAQGVTCGMINSARRGATATTDFDRAVHMNRRNFVDSLIRIAGSSIEADVVLASIVSECIAAVARVCDMRGIVWLNDPLIGDQPVVGEMTSNSPEAESVVVTAAGQSFEVALSTVEHANIPSQNLVDDLTQLDFMSPLSILNTLRHRYCGGAPHHDGDHPSWYCTFIGNILIYINPYSPTGAWKNDFLLQSYLAEKSRVRESRLQPHPYAIADTALRQLLDMQSDQAVYVAGESGAGKTEACKMMLEFLMNALVQPDRSGPGVASILARSDFALEAFGNAKTINNDNSSRFVKYVRLTIVDPPRPKRAKSDVEFYLDEQRQTHKWLGLAKQKPITWISTQLKTEWETLPKNDQAPYKRKAQADRQRFDSKMAKCSALRTGQLIGATVQASLLERNRVCGLTSGDPFHIFKYIQQADEQDSGNLDSVAGWLRDIDLTTAEVAAAFDIVRATQSLLGIRFDERDCVALTDSASIIAVSSLASQLGVNKEQLISELNRAVDDSALRRSDSKKAASNSARSKSTKASIAKTLYDGVFDIVLQQFNTYVGQDARFWDQTEHTCSECDDKFVLPQGMPVRRSKFMCLPCYRENALPMLTTRGMSKHNWPSASMCTRCNSSACPTFLESPEWGGRCAFCRKVHCWECSTKSLPGVALQAAGRLGQQVELCCYSCISKMSVHNSQDAQALGILDIFGCERFADNGLDVMCVNFVNERMHQSFLAEVFHVERTVYESEGIDISSTGIVFQDNAQIIELLCGSLAGNKNENIFAIMNNPVHADSEEAFQRDLSEQLGTKLRCKVSTFTVQHYFGPVEYGGENESRFCEKNRDQTYDRFFTWWRDRSTNALAKRLRVVKVASAFSGADVSKHIVEDPIIHADLGAEILRVARRIVPDSITKSQGYWKGRITTVLPPESGWTVKMSGGGIPFYKADLLSSVKNKTQYHPPRYVDDDGEGTQYVPPPFVEKDVKRGSSVDSSGRLVIYVTVYTKFNGSTLVTLRLRTSLRVICNDHGQASAVDVKVADTFERLTSKLGAKHRDQQQTQTEAVERKNVTAQGTQDPITALLTRRLSKIVQAHAAWIFARGGDVDGIGGLSMKAHGEMSTTDLLKDGTDALFASIPKETRPSFIRCINPKTPGIQPPVNMRGRFATQHVLQQLTNSGIVDTVQAR